MADSLLVLTAPTAGVKVLAVSVPQLAREAAERHGLAEGSAAVLGQALAGSLLLVACEDVPADVARVDVQLECRGPLRGLLVDADGSGAVRGMVRVPELDRSGRMGDGAAAEGGLARFDARPLLEGPATDDRVGMLSILRRQPGGTETDLHRALVPFAGADLGAGLTAYLQSDRALAGHLAVEVLYRPDEPLAVVAGVLIAPLAEENVPAARRIGEGLQRGGLVRLLKSGASNAHAMSQWVAEAYGLGPLQLQSELRPRFSCRCSRERLVRALQTLGAPELLDMADKDGGAEATCDFCAASYVVSKEELRALAEAGEPV